MITNDFSSPWLKTLNLPRGNIARCVDKKLELFLCRMLVRAQL